MRLTGTTDVKSERFTPNSWPKFLLVSNSSDSSKVLNVNDLRVFTCRVTDLRGKVIYYLLNLANKS